MLERDMEELIARFSEDLFHGMGLELKGRQQSFFEVGRFDLLFKDQYGTNVPMELKARVAKYEDASQLAKYKDELQRRGVTNILMWLVSPQIPNSVREFLDGIGIEYSEIHEAQFRRVAERHGFQMSVLTPPVHMSASQPPLTRASRRDNVPEYRLNTNFGKEKLEDLIRQFEAAAKRRIDNSLAIKLRKELLDGNPPAVSIATVKQLAKWCNTNNPLYCDGMEIARKISKLLFSQTLDRTRLGV
jgi:Endonuclease NucS C-terminal domain